MRVPLFLASCLSILPIQAQLYWDTNGAVAGSGNAGGSWDTGTNWTSDSTGSIVTSPWASGSAVRFSAGTDGTGTIAITAAGPLSASSVVIEEGAVVWNGLGVTIAGALNIQRGTAATSLELSGAGTTSAGNIGIGNPLIIGGQTGTATLVIKDNHALTTGNLFLGEQNGHGGNVTQSGGTVSASGQIRIAHWPSETSNYTINAGQLNSNGGLYVGWNGTGQMTASGTADVNVTGGAFIQSGSTLSIEGTSSFDANYMSIGDANGAGNVVQNNGAVSIASGELRIGHYPTTGSYTINAGTLTVSGTGTGAESSGVITIGVDGTGTFTQAGGTVTTRGIYLDSRGATIGTDTYSMTGGTLVLTHSLGIAGNGTNSTFLVNLGGGTIQANTDTNLSVPATLTGTNGNTTFNTNGNTITVSGVLSGAGGLTKSGAGTLALTAHETYTGNTSVTGGILQLNTGRIYSNNGWVARSIAISGGATVEVGGWADGDTVGGFGQVDFAAANIVVNNGTIKYTGSSTTGNADRGFTIGSGGATLEAASSNPFTLNQGRGFGVTSAAGGKLTLSGTQSGVWNMNLGGTGGLDKTGSGTWTISGTNTYTGQTNLAGGTTTVTGTINGTSYFRNNTASTTSTLNIQGSALIQTSGAGAYLAFGDQNSAVITINQSGGTLTNLGTTNLPGSNNVANRWGHWPNATTTYNLSGGTLNLTSSPLYLSWDSAATLNITGGTANIQGFNMGYNGRTQNSTITVGGTGRLNIGSDGIITGGTASKTINLSGGTLGAFADWSTSRPINVTANSTINTLDSVDNITGRTISLSGILSGAGGLTKSGLGTLTLAAANTYSGGTTVNAGTLDITGSLAPQTITINAGTLSLSGAAYNMLGNPSGAITIAAGATMTANNATNNAHNLGAVALNGGTLTSINGPGGAANDGGFGNWLLRGVTVAGSSQSTISSSTVAIVSGDFSVSDAVAGPATDLLVSSRIISGSVTKTGPGTLTLTAVNTYAGPTVVNGGELRVDGSITGTSSVTVASGAKLQGIGTITTTGSTTINGRIAPGNSIGTLTLAGPVTLSGVTATAEFEIVNPMVNGLTHTPSAVIMNAGTTLDNPTLITGATRVAGQNDVLIINGATPTLTFNTGSTLEVLMLPNTPPTGLLSGIAWDLIDAGIITIGGANGFWGVANDYTYHGGNGVQYGDIILNLPDLWNGTTDGYYNWNLSLFESHGIIVLVPEPSRAFLVLVTLIPFALRRRRHGKI